MDDPWIVRRDVIQYGLVIIDQLVIGRAFNGDLGLATDGSVYQVDL